MPGARYRSANLSLKNGLTAANCRDRRAKMAALQKLLIRSRFKSITLRLPCISISKVSQGSSALSFSTKTLSSTFLANVALPDRLSSPKSTTFALKYVELAVKGSPRGSNPALPWMVQKSGFHDLADRRLPKRRPSMRSRRKRASMKPPGPYAWVQYTPGEPIPRSRPNEGSVQGRKHRKRMEQRSAFRSAQAKIRKQQLADARRKKRAKRIERKMAAVARERAWAERLAQLQEAEAEVRGTAA